MDSMTVGVAINFAEDVVVEIPGSVPGTSHVVCLGKLTPALVLSLYAIAEQLEDVLISQNSRTH